MRPPLHSLTSLLLFALASLCGSGCVIVTHKSKDGPRETETTYVSPAFGNKGISSADFQKGIVKGVTSEQSSMGEVLGAVYSAGLAAGAKAVTQ